MILILNRKRIVFIFLFLFWVQSNFYKCNRTRKNITLYIYTLSVDIIFCFWSVPKICSEVLLSSLKFLITMNRRTNPDQNRFDHSTSDQRNWPTATSTTVNLFPTTSATSTTVNFFPTVVVCLYKSFGFL